MLAYFLHNLSPHVISFGGGFAVHWYGLAYVMGFYCGYLMMVHLAKKGLGSLKPDKVGDFITFAALFGVVLGGRLGYMLLYRFGDFVKDPVSLFKLWDGGMASHGGIAGLALFSLWYAHRHKISWTGIGDNLVVAAPIGIFFGRMANFVNGELYGRATDVSWAWKFPTELNDREMRPSEIGFFVEPDVFPRYSNEIVALAKTIPDGMTKLEAALTPRHPSQLYEGALEGIFLFLILFLVRTRVKNLPNGVITGLFFIIYALVRIAVENFREPDVGVSFIMGLTRGQFYSTFMILIGAAFIVGAYVFRKPSAQDPAPPAA